MEYDCKVPEYAPKEGNGIIYLYTLDDGKQYVGQTITSLKYRHTLHIYSNNTLFDRAIKSHKWRLEVIGEYHKSELNTREMEEIAKHNSIVPNGYNNHLAKRCKRKRAVYIKINPQMMKDKNLHEGEWVIVTLKKVAE